MIDLNHWFVRAIPARLLDTEYVLAHASTWLLYDVAKYRSILCSRMLAKGCGATTSATEVNDHLPNSPI